MLHLSQTDVRVLDQLALGRNRKQIARALDFSEGYVEQRFQWIQEVFGLKSFGKNVRILMVLRWISPLFRIGLEELGIMPCLTKTPPKRTPSQASSVCANAS
jgi:DNA-binding CsgD family transcriptional regulator